MPQWNRVLYFGQRQVGTGCDEFFQSGSERTSLSERHI